MAETEAESVPNGTGGLSAEEDDERLKQRPADIDADVREMERRKRVEAIMSSKLFREELERVLDQQLSEGGGGGAAPLLQRIREMVGGAGAARLQAGAFKGGNCVLPINDIRGIEGMGYEKGEKILRCKLAAVYRLVDLYGWTQAGVSGQITARLNTAVEHFLTAPRGLLPHEVTASSLVKLDMQGAVQDHGTTNFPVNLTGFSLHACVHAARPDVRCVLHVRSPAALAVSAQRDGLLPLCSEAALLGDLAYHQLPPGALDNEERDKLVRALGPTAKILVLSNGGALCCGETLEEAFYQAKCLTAACDVQLRLASVPVDKLNLLDDDTRKQLYDASRRAPADGVKWRVGGEEFEALMRMLDNAGYRTGYIYRHPLVKGDVPKPKSDVEVPPAVSSLGYLLEEEELYRQGLWKKIDGRKTGDRTRWLNSPNVYQKVEVLETGTNDPKKITKWVDANTDEWVQDGSPAHSSTPVKIDAALQFVPKNTNPKEFKQLQQQIKDNRRADKISAGPQSHILEGVTWDEANKLNAEDAAATHTGDHVVLMGAASKGIIQRGYQHNATVYSAPYARNPFDQVSDRDLDEYKRTVERKARGEYDADVSESEGVSAAQLTSPDCQPSETEEESRDDHRILRIETKQAPRPSQPEVVLSDDSTADFLANERRAAERTPRGESALLSDDEVFLAAPLAGSGAGAVEAGAVEAGAAAPVRVGGGVLADGSLLVRSYNAPVQQNIVKEFQEITKHVSSLHSHANSNQVLPVSSNQDVLVSLNEVLQQDHITNQLLHRRYPRSSNFESVVKIFESPEKESDQSSSSRHPHRSRCRTSSSSDHLCSEEVVKNIKPSSEDMVRNNRQFYENVNTDSIEFPSTGFQALSTDRSSVYSSWSYEWDAGRTNHDCWSRTRSLPRSKTCHKQRTLFRTRSHSGFLNSNDVEPKHFHLPRCKSCDAYNVNYAWEVEGRRLTQTDDFEDTLCLAMDIEKNKTDQSECSENILHIPKNRAVNDGEKDIPKDRLTSNCAKREASLVKVKMANVPVLRNAVKINFADVTNYGQEFVYNQEFDDECYIDSGGSFSSGNQTVIEKVTEDGKQDTANETLLKYKEVKNPDNVFIDKFEKEITETSDSIEAEFDSASDRTDEDFTKDTTCGDYINFSDYEDNLYESPVKDLVLKDIRNYSVPITIYCDDFTKYVQAKGPKRSPTKAKPLTLPTILEPILEESKSSYGEESVASAKESGPSASNNDTQEDCAKEVLLETIEGRAETILDIVTIVDDIVMDSVTVAKENIKLLENDASEITENLQETCITTNEASACDGNTVAIATEDNSESEEHYCIEELPMDSANVCSPTTREKTKTTKIVEEMEYSANEGIFKVPKRPESNRSSSVTSSTFRESFDSTREFERIEAVSEVLGTLLDRASVEHKLTEVLNKENEEFLDIVSRRKANTAKQLAIYEQINDEIHVEEAVETPKQSPEEKEIIENKNPDSETNVQEAYVNDDINNDFGDKGGITNDNLNKNIEELESGENTTILEISAVRNSEYLKTDTSYLGAIGLVSSTFGNSDYLIDGKNVFDGENYMLAEECNHTSEHNLRENESLSDSLECMNEFLEQNKCNADFGSTFSLSKGLHIVDPICTCTSYLEIKNQEPISCQVNSGESQEGHNMAFDNEDCNIFSDCENNSENELVQNALQMAKESKKYMTADENGNYAGEVVEYILEIVMNGSTAQYENNALAELSNDELDLYVSKICDIDPNALDTAFVESSYLESITSSPIDKTTSKIEEFDESPIKNLSQNLFEREDAILGSPFIKSAPVLTMSHEEQKGGVKFWISFDDNLSETFDRPLCRRLGNLDDKTPSFLLAELAESANNSTQLDSRESITNIYNNSTESDANEMDKRQIKTDFFEQAQSRKSVLCIREANRTVDETEEIAYTKFAKGNDSFETAAALSNPGSSTFSTCDSAPVRDVAILASDTENVDYLVQTAGREKVRKVYDSSKTGQMRRGSSWPPYEDTLFYKIVSKFRMSESFDPNEFEKLSL